MFGISDPISNIFYFFKNPHYFSVGDGATEPCLSNERHSTVETSFDLLLNENLFGIEDCNSKLALSCSKKENIRKPEEWEIVDETYKKTYSKIGFKFLFTFHILPLTAMRKSIQKFWTSCDSKEGICADDAEFQKCDKMFIEFVRRIDLSCDVSLKF